MQEEFGDGFIPFEYHISGVFSTSETAARGSWYGVDGVPAVRIDGKYSVNGAQSCDQTSAAYRARIQERFAETGGLSPVQITGSFIPGDEAVRIRATFELVDPASLTSLHAMLILYEDEILYGGKHWQHVVRVIVDEPVALQNVGDHVLVERTIPTDPGWNPAEIHAVAFLQQTTGTRPVIQAARLPFGDFDWDVSRCVVSLPSGNGEAIFEAGIRNVGPAPDTLLAGLDVGSFSGWDASVEGSLERRLDPGEETIVRVHVRTDASRAIRSGVLRISSRGSGREDSEALEVFNGGRSLLLVDDDGARTDEVTVVEALDARDVLHDVWDSYHDHGQESPLLEEMRDYDVVLWLTGFDLGTYPLDRFDIDALDRCMAGGSSICLSSQGFLNGIAGTSDFVEGDLGIASWTLDTGYVHLDGTPGDPIGGGLSLDLQFNGPYQSKGDDAAPIASASVALTAPNGSRALLRNEAPDGARAVFMPVALHAVSATAADPNNLRTVLGRILDWLEEPMTADAIALPGDLPASLRVVPNPAHGSVGISFVLETAGWVRLTVLDASGRNLGSVHEAVLEPGPHTWTWDVTGEGIRFLRLTEPGGIHATKVIVLR
jgi:hypothetical protein